MARHGLTHEDLMSVRLKSSTYGVINERAVYRKAIKPEDFKQGDPEAKMAGPVAWPLRVGDVAQTQMEAPVSFLQMLKRQRAFPRNPSGY